MLHQAIKGVMRINRDDIIEEENQQTNLASIFINKLINIKHVWNQGEHPMIYLGGLLLPLFQDVGVDLSDHEALPKKELHGLRVPPFNEVAHWSIRKSHHLHPRLLVRRRKHERMFFSMPEVHPYKDLPSTQVPCSSSHLLHATSSSP